MKEFVLVLVIFLIFYFVPFNTNIVQNSILNGFLMLQEYAREHVLLCLVPAFFIAGTISVMLNKSAVLKLLGPKAKKIISYPVAAISGGILAVCSCTILPLFGGIYKKGAGIGPATTFLFSGPAINIAAIFLTARVLGWNLGLARLFATITAAILIGLIMESLFQEKGEGGFHIQEESKNGTKVLIFFSLQLSFLIISGLKINYLVKYSLMSLTSLSVVIMAVFFFKKEETKSWLEETWDFAKKILPYLFIGVFFSGILTKLLPQEIVTKFLGNNGILSNLFASIIGMFMYFATLTEVPIVQALRELGMAKGPTLALLMAGNSLSLPSMIVITKLFGRKKAFSYFSLVVLFSTIFGIIYGHI
ncbi:permease [Thermosipho melanesiensis]|uniref:Permease n=2 Tax=Thermosipho melanesiensis TaxID=46541 RepID=A6LL88_THEM4|nr:permease [Thermosipho melanesiensis]ABR30689.1 permease [Thermosipho melanesiensis BI429]APT73820.1 permease [Thermosipho melanesiensis]OOC39057.1 permease [Thermosipho melanesiensis]OOC39205.1 permease [Thermosipho melanesiensis]OOC41732.1 permease [Thermosipho melanesiensis]